MSENRFEDKKFPQVIFNSLSQDKLDELRRQGLIEEGEWYVTNDAFKDNVGGLDVLDIGQSLYIDESQGLRRWLNGSWVDINDNTRKFYEKLMKASALNPDILCTPTEYDSIVANSAFHQCGKFALDVANSKVRLPKIVYADGSLNISNIGNINSQRILIAKKEPTENDKSWFNWYSDGWYEQGGYMYTTGSATGSDQQRDIYFTHNFRDRNYNVFLSSGVGNSGWQYANGAMLGSGSNQDYGVWQFTDHFHMCLPNGTTNMYCYWRAEGYANIPSDADITISRPLQYYYIQIATGVEQVIDITNTYELNNSHTLGESIYSPIQLNNVSWLRGGSHGTRAEYPSYYDMLLKVYNGEETINGITVKLEGDDTINRLDHVINLENESFVLPTLNGTEDVPSKKGQGEDRINLTSEVTASDTIFTAPYNGWYRFSTNYEAEKYVDLFNETTFQSAIQSPGSSGTYIFGVLYANKGDTVHVKYNVTAIGSLYFLIATKPGYLYYYVGDMVQNANLINAGKLSDNKPTTTLGAWNAENNRTYCRKYEDGWCEQGGYIYRGSSMASQTLTITFPQPFKDTNYVCTFNHVHSANGVADTGSENWNNRTKNSTQYYVGGGGWFGIAWRASGYYK